MFQVVKLGSHDLFMADILGVSVDEKLLDPAGRLQLEKADLLAYAHGEYFALGPKVGSFGFSVRKKQKHTVAKTAAQKNTGSKYR